MTYIAMTPFGRTVDAVLLDRLRDRPEGPAPAGVDKWQVLRDLTAARETFGLKSRTLLVLQALLSFHKGTALGDSPAGFVVHPSNATLSERLAGMPLSTLRRHIATLVEAGLLARRDSPNGKRYVRRDPSGREPFGLDLAPLAHRAMEITEAAESAREEAEAIVRTRRRIALMRRDRAALSEHPSCASLVPSLPDEEIARLLRRKLTDEALREIEAALQADLEVIRHALALPRALETSTEGTQNERHLQRTRKEGFESGETISSTRAANLDLPRVLHVCRELASYAPGPLRSWEEMTALVERLAPMIGVSRAAWKDAVKCFGRIDASVIVAAILEELDSIRAPSAYLAGIERRAKHGAMTSTCMIRAIERRRASQL